MVEGVGCAKGLVWCNWCKADGNLYLLRHLLVRPIFWLGRCAQRRSRAEPKAIAQRLALDGREHGAPSGRMKEPAGERRRVAFDSPQTASPDPDFTVERSQVSRRPTMRTALVGGSPVSESASIALGVTDPDPRDVSWCERPPHPFRRHPLTQDPKDFPPRSLRVRTCFRLSCWLHR